MFAPAASQKPIMAGFDLFHNAKEEEVEIWPENLPVVRLFERVRTQWRPAPAGGVLGLDYGVLFRLLDNERLSAEEWDSMFSDVQTMEYSALEAIHEKRD